MLLTLTTTHEPATDLGYLLVKHPDRVHAFEVPTGTAYVCFPEASPRRCTAALILDVDPARLSNGWSRRPDGFTLGRFVNDRPYAASSLLAAALNRAFRSAMRGECRDRPELATTALGLTVAIPALRCRGGAPLALRLLEPLGWRVDAVPVPLDPTRPEWGESHYLDLTMTGTLRLADALNQLYVLLPVFDDAKHYWVAPDEVDKLVRAGAGWLAGHPERELVTRRYLAHSRTLDAVASERLDALRMAESMPDPDTVDSPTQVTEEDAELPPAAQRVPLAEQRRQAVIAELGRGGAATVLDLGCGSGALLADLVRDRRFTHLVGVDVSTQALTMAQRRLRLDRAPPVSARSELASPAVANEGAAQRQRGRVSLVQSALTYVDDRLLGYDAAVLMEVIEHIDPPRLPALAATVFGHAKPSTVVVTTPNVEYNVRYGLQQPMRHHDHRFEWTRVEFTAWCARVATAYGYDVSIAGVGEEDSELGHPTQLATFTRKGAP